MSSNHDFRGSQGPSDDADAADPDASPAQARSISESTTSPAFSGAIGLLQGLLLWWLWTSSRHAADEYKPLLWGAAALLSTGTVAWWLLDQGLGRMFRRVATSIAVGALNGWLYWSLSRTLAIGNDALPFDRSLAIALADFMLVALAAGFDGARRRFDYDRMFELSWRNGLLLAVAIGMTGLLWVLLLTGGALLKMVGVPQLQAALRDESTIVILSSTAFGLAMGVSLKRAGALVVLRGFCLSLLRWFLPLALALSLAWCIALIFSGLGGLLESHRTGFTMMWFCALTIAFANAAWLEQSGPVWLVRCEVLALPLLIVVAGVADYALWLRTTDVGLTEDRIWGWVAAVAISLHALGYGSSIFSRSRRWLPFMPATNIAVSSALVIALFILASPWGDVSRLAVSQQVARLQSGRVSPNDFDWPYLTWQSGPAGREALHKLAASPADTADTRVASIGLKAREALALRQPLPEAMADVDSDVRWWRDNVPVWPAGSRVDDALLRVLVQAYTPWSGRPCKTASTGCALWLVDIDKDGSPEVVWLQPGQPDGTRLSLYALRDGRWQLAAPPKPSTRSVTEWKDAVAAGQALWQPPRFPDLILGNERLMFNDELFGKPTPAPAPPAKR